MIIFRDYRRVFFIDDIHMSLIRCQWCCVVTTLPMIKCCDNSMMICCDNLLMMTCRNDVFNAFNVSMSLVLCQWWHVVTTFSMISYHDYFVDADISQLLVNDDMSQLLVNDDTTFFKNDIDMLLLLGLCWPVATTLSMVTCHDYFVNDGATACSMMTSTCCYYFVNDDMLRLLCQ